MKFGKLLPTVALLCAAGISAAAKHAPASFLVKVTGHGKPMILLPGLNCGGDVWNSTVSHFQDKYECHVLTLPGFAGQPAIKPPMLQTVRDDIIAYITDHHLDHPILIGHGLGGYLALWIAAKAPALVGKVVSVDGLPWLPARQDPLAKMSAVIPQASTIRSMLQSMDQKEFEAACKRSLESMITDSKDLAFVLKSAVLSDPKSVGEAMFEMYTDDLRSQMSKIVAPVLLLGEEAGVTDAPGRQVLSASYEDQIHSVPNRKFAMSEKSKGFIMLDDPSFFFAQVDAFLA